MDMDVHGEAVQFGDFRFDRKMRHLARRNPAGAWEPVALGSRALEMLGVLLDRPGQVVSRDTIIDAVWPGVAVEPNNLTVQMAALRRVLDDGSPDGSIQTVPGRGYRFILPVHRSEGPPAVAGTQEPDAAAIPPTGTHRLWPWAAALSGVAVLGILVAVIGWYLSLTSRTPPPLSIVVLPFENLSDHGEDYLADGITYDLTTDLSRIPGMFVIARASAHSYQGKIVDVRKVGQELGVRYVLEGSVRKFGDVLRVNAQLISAQTSAQLWGDRFDQKISDLGSGQEEIVRRVGKTLNVALWDVENVRSKRERPANPNAFDLILRAESIDMHTMGPREHAERIRLFEQALRLDPTAVLAMTGLANELIRHTFTGYGADGDDLQRAAKLLADAASINHDSLSVQGNAAFLLYAQGRYTESIAAFQSALKDYPNFDRGYAQIADCLIQIGRADESIPMTEMAMRIDPRSSYSWSRYDNMSLALLLLGRDQESIAWTQRALEANPDNAAEIRGKLTLRLAAAYARLGNLDGAHRATAEANRIWPFDTVRTRAPADPTSPALVAQIQAYQAALRLAGHRDHAQEDADFGVRPDRDLHRILPGPTPTTLAGATIIRTGELQQFLIDRNPVLIDPMLYSWGRSIPGAIGLKNAGFGGSLTDSMQDRLARKMRELTHSDRNKPIVAMGWNSERFDGYNLALRLVALGYTNVYWYRGGREAWEVAGLPESEIDAQPW